MRGRTWAALAGALLIGACASSPQPTPAVIPTPSPTAQATPNPTPSPTAQTTPTATAQPSPTAEPTPTPDPRIDGYRNDLLMLIDLREQHHPDPWHGIAREDYVAAVADVAARVPELTDNQMLVELARLAALPSLAGRDGHGGTFPWAEGSNSLYPLRLYWFSDGLYVVDAQAPYRELVGWRVDAINGHAIQNVLDAVDPLTSRDNYGQVLVHGPLLAGTAEVLEGLGLIDDATEPVPFTFSRNADGVEETQTVEVRPIPATVYLIWGGGHHLHSPPERPDGPLWLHNIDDDAWFEVDEESRTLYLGYNMTDHDVLRLIADMQEIIDAGDVDRFVVDVRHNGGGDNTTYGLVVNLINRATERLRDGAYVIMGRSTFSAAGNFVADVEERTTAVLVGEDSGGSPNQYGDSYGEMLPFSRQMFYVARLYVIRTTRDDLRLTVEPSIAAPLSSADYFGDRDPALEAILADAS